MFLNILNSACGVILWMEGASVCRTRTLFADSNNTCVDSHKSFHLGPAVVSVKNVTKLMMVRYVTAIQGFMRFILITLVFCTVP